MSDNKDQIVWSDKRHREIIVEQRKFIWFEDTLDKLAKWFGMTPGMTVADIGSGLGYLGFAYWKYFGKDGKYIGVDNDEDLIKDARKASNDWTLEGEAEFLVSSAYELPLDDNLTDITMCQTLLMHLEKPEIALQEMVRITKSGGIVICFEPDNLTAHTSYRFNSLPEMSIEDRMLFIKVAYTAHYGRIILGRGDQSIGIKVPHMMTTLGLKEVEARLNDRIFLLESPYESPIQKQHFKMFKRNMVEDDRYNYIVDRQKEEFLAAGGDPQEMELCIEKGEEYRQQLKKHFEAEDFFHCSSGDFYVIKGRKVKE